MCDDGEMNLADDGAIATAAQGCTSACTRPPCFGVDCGSEGSCANGHCTILGSIWFTGVNDQSCDSVCGDQGLRCRGESFQALVDAGDATMRAIAAATNVDCQPIEHSGWGNSPWFRDLAVLPNDHRCFYGAGGTCGAHSSNSDRRPCPCIDL
eukprot:SAG31_NODE_846_length_11539_cov_70.858392_11_plen_153_part_00